MARTRLRLIGISCLILGALAWTTTYLPPGTMTSIALGAMAAIGLAITGLAVLAASLLVRR